MNKKDVWMTGEKLNFSIFDLNGNLKKQEVMNANVIQSMNINNFANGMYLVKATDGAQTVIRTVVV